MKKILVFVILFASLTATGQVCQIGSTNYSDLGTALTAVQSGQTIKLLTNITHNSRITIDGKSITFDLNGKTLNVNMTGGTANLGLSVSNNGEVKLLDPLNGTFNVYNSQFTGVAVNNGGKATVSNINVNAGNSYMGAMASGAGSQITVIGNITNTGSGGYGVAVSDGGTVSVDGSIAATYYIGIVNGSTSRTLAQNYYTTPTTKPGYFTYTDGISTVWVKMSNYSPDCQIGATQYSFDEALAVVQNNQTIKLLADINYNSGIAISGKSITFDLNGKNLNVVNTTGDGLTVSNSSEVKLLNPSNGTFNVNSSYAYGNGVSAESGGKATVTNASGLSQGVSAIGAGSQITVTGNIIGANTGAFVVSGGIVTVDGTINATYYINIAGDLKSQTQYSTSTKPGYFTYTDGSSTVWVKKQTYNPNCQIGATQYEFDEALGVVQNNQTIKLLDNITFNSGISISGKSVTFDLNGKNLNVVNANGNGLEVINNGQVNLLDPSNGTLNVTGSTYGVYVASGGKAAVTNATTTYMYGYYAGAYATGAGSQITTVTASESGNYGNYGAQVVSGGTITVDGTISARNYVYIGNTVKTQAQNTAPTTKTGYLTYTDGTSTVWVKDTRSPVCSIASTQFVGLDEALYAVQTGQTIKLLTDITYNSGISISGKSITFDLNGKNLNVNTSGNGLEVTNNGEVKLLDPTNGTFNVTGSTNGIYAENGGKTTVSNVTVTGNSGKGVSATGSGTQITVTGNIKGTGTGSLGVSVSSGGNVTIDGTITASNYVNISGTTKTQTQNTVPSTKPGYFTYTDGASTVWIKNPNFSPNCQIGTTQYEFVDALSVVQNNQTIKLLDNITYNSGIAIEGKSITIDLNGKNLSVNNATGNGLSVTNYGEVKLLNPKNGTFNVTGSTSGVYVASGGKATVTNATSTGTSNTDCKGVYATDANSQVTVTNNIISNISFYNNANTYGVYVSFGGIVTVDGNVTSVGTNYYAYKYAIGVYITSGGTVSIGGNITANYADIPYGVYITSGGTATVEGIIDAFNYINVNNNTKYQYSYTIPSTKTGYFTYSNGTSIVWVKDPNYIPASNVSISASANGSSGVTTSTSINLVFSQAVTGLTVNDIVISDGTGSAVKGALSGSGTNRTLTLTSVTREGNISLSINDFGTFHVTNNPQTVAVYKESVSPAKTDVSVLSASANGSSGVTTSTSISLVFSREVTGLTANDIVITDGTGSAVKGALTGSGTNRTLTLTSVTREGNISLSINDFGTFHVTNNPQTVAVYKESVSPVKTDVSVLYASANGSSGVSTSTSISLVFSREVTGLTANDIVISDGTGSAVKGALSGSGTNRTLALTSVTREGNISLSINDFGSFHVTNNPQTVAVYKESVSPVKTDVSIIYALANGISGVSTSTGINLVFSREVTGLTANDIVITDGTGSAVKGTLTGSGTNRTLELASVTREGNISLSINDFGSFHVTNNPQTIAVYKESVSPAKTDVSIIYALANGISGVSTSTGINLVFSQAVTGLTANDIVITDGTGSAVKGALTGSGTNRTLELTNVTREGNISLSINDFGTFHVTNNPQTVAVYKESNNVAIETVEPAGIIIFSQNGNLIVESKMIPIAVVSIYDVKGQLLKIVETKSNTLTISLPNNQILLVKVLLNNGQTVIKKVLFNKN